MEDINTLIDMLAFRAAVTPDKVAYTYSDSKRTFITMWDEIKQFASFLMENDFSPGENAIILLPNGDEFFSAFYGIQRAAGIAVPLFPGSGIERVRGIAELCGARFIVVPSELPKQNLTDLRSKGAEYGLNVVTVNDSQPTQISACFPNVTPEDIAFIQYTSGSTGNPKGVMLSHDNLLTNMHQMIAGMEISPQDIFVSWLPAYHDMGLILKTMVPFYLAAELHLLPTNLKDIERWINALHRHRATFTAAPDFAYRLCVRYVQDPAQYDLSSLRVALNAAEPVRAQTINEFETKFGLKNAMVAGYGLAEATVGVSMWPPGKAALIDDRGFVSVGKGFPDVELLIVNEYNIARPGEIGEIAIKSTANSKGYLNNPKETADLFRIDGYLLSGDLGYLDDSNNLFIVGRKKNIIKHAGETIAPQEVEEIIDRHPNVRFSAAVGIDRGRLEGEQVYIFAEIRQGEVKTEDHMQEVMIELVQVFHQSLGFRPGRVYLLKPKSIPQTFNGKIQHSRLKESYLQGSLRTDDRILFPDY